jgi:hypothetical protein
LDGAVKLVDFGNSHGIQNVIAVEDYGRAYSVPVDRVFGGVDTGLCGAASAVFDAVIVFGAVVSLIGGVIYRGIAGEKRKNNKNSKY